jgi:hypothetical protein
MIRALATGEPASLSWRSQGGAMVWEGSTDISHCGWRCVGALATVVAMVDIGDGDVNNDTTKEN